MKNAGLYELVKEKVTRIERLLKAMERWQDQPLPDEKFKDMGAFGSNTMTFEQWIQFVLLERINQIILSRGDFPYSSMVGTYAVRYFDGDAEATELQQQLYELDGLINNTPSDDLTAGFVESNTPQSSETVSLGDTKIPDVVYQVVNTLQYFTADDLESQLQSIDVFLQILSPSTREPIILLLENAAKSHPDECSRARIELAIQSMQKGGRLAEAYNHDKSMKKYQAGHRKNFMQHDEDQNDM
jgi:uncharacterized protein YqcC (DUF446 family)